MENQITFGNEAGGVLAKAKKLAIWGGVGAPFIGAFVEGILRIVARDGQAVLILIGQLLGFAATIVSVVMVYYALKLIGEAVNNNLHIIYKRAVIIGAAIGFVLAAVVFFRIYSLLDGLDYASMPRELLISYIAQDSTIRVVLLLALVTFIYVCVLMFKVWNNMTKISDNKLFIAHYILAIIGVLVYSIPPVILIVAIAMIIVYILAWVKTKNIHEI